MENNFFSAIIVAAGNSSRMGGKESKMFIDLLGKKVIARTVEIFSLCSLINEIIIVCRDEDKERISSFVNTEKPLKFAKGGETRQESVLNGLKTVDEQCEYLVIHDGARPLVTQKEILDVLSDAIKYKAATLGTKVKDTIKITKDGFIETTPNRDFLYAVQTPQVFLRSLYMKAAEKFKDGGFTDDCKLIEEYGEKVYITNGEYTNIKITTTDDITLAEAILKGREEK